MSVSAVFGVGEKEPLWNWKKIELFSIVNALPLYLPQQFICVCICVYIFIHICLSDMRSQSIGLAYSCNGFILWRYIYEAQLAAIAEKTLKFLLIQPGNIGMGFDQPDMGLHFDESKHPYMDNWSAPVRVAANTDGWSISHFSSWSWISDIEYVDICMCFIGSLHHSFMAKSGSSMWTFLGLYPLVI